MPIIIMINVRYIRLIFLFFLRVMGRPASEYKMLITVKLLELGNISKYAFMARVDFFPFFISLFLRHV